MPAAPVALALADVRAYATELYDVETRPALVASALRLAVSKVGIDLADGKNAEKIISAVGEMTTVAGLLENKKAAMEIAAPYIAKARDADGRKELAEELAATQIVQEGKAMLSVKVVEPVSARISAGKELAAPYVSSGKEYVSSAKEYGTARISAGKEMAAPYVSSAKEYAAPYASKLTELRNSERVESMITAFQEVRRLRTHCARFPPPYLPRACTLPAAPAPA